MNWFMALKVVCCEPVAVSPETCVSALSSGVPDSANSALKAAGKVAPLMSALSIPAATFFWLTLAVPGRFGDSSPGSSVNSTELPT